MECSSDKFLFSGLTENRISEKRLSHKASPEVTVNASEANIIKIDSLESNILLKIFI
jgi:hypothetical protein